MKVDTKDLKKLVDLLIKEQANMAQIYTSTHDNHISIKFTDRAAHEVEVKIYDVDSGFFSKIVREDRF